MSETCAAQWFETWGRKAAQGTCIAWGSRGGEPAGSYNNNRMELRNQPPTPAPTTASISPTYSQTAANQQRHIPLLVLRLCWHLTVRLSLTCGEGPVSIIKVGEIVRGFCESALPRFTRIRHIERGTFPDRSSRRTEIRTWAKIPVLWYYDSQRTPGAWVNPN